MTHLDLKTRNSKWFYLLYNRCFPEVFSLSLAKAGAISQKTTKCLVFLDTRSIFLQNQQTMRSLHPPRGYKSCARIFRPSFRENKPKTLVFSHTKRAFWAGFREYWVYNFGHCSSRPRGYVLNCVFFYNKKTFDCLLKSSFLLVKFILYG